jgi:processive 1,2-diacylglycerol beta-glucosyltransferase
MGEGHNRAALAVSEALAARGHTCETLDALRLLNFDERELHGRAARKAQRREHTHRSGSDIASAAYGWAAFKAPALFGAVYTAGEVVCRAPFPSPVYLQNQKYAAETWAYIEDRRFDVVISTHTFPLETMSAIRKRYPSKVRYYGVLTDYTPTPFFAEAALDGYFIGHPDLMRKCRRAGLPEAITYPTGIPISRRFHRPTNADEKAKVRLGLGLPPDVPIFLLMSGGVGSQNAPATCDHLLAEGGEKVHVVIMTGRRTDFYKSTTARYQLDARVSVIPFTERVPEYMTAADVILSKPGGVSSTEAAVSGVPLIHTAAIPGCETKNAQFFSTHGMSLYNQRPTEAARLACWLLDDRAKVASMLSHQAANIPLGAADRVVDRLEGPT